MMKKQVKNNENQAMDKIAKQVEEMAERNLQDPEFNKLFEVLEEIKGKRLENQKSKNKYIFANILYYFELICIALIIIFLLISCERIEFGQWEQTTIQGDSHSTIDHMEFMKKDRKLDKVLEFNFKFESSMTYQINTSDSLDYNKLFGISTSKVIADKNAVKIGWRWSKEKFCFETSLVYDYGYGRDFHPLNDFEIGETALFHISVINGKVFACTETSEVEIKLKKPFEYYFMTNIWFGGNCCAPHDIDFKYKLIGYKND